MKHFYIDYEYTEGGENFSESEFFCDLDEAEDRYNELLTEQDGLTLLRLTYEAESGGVAYEGGIVKEFEPEVIYTGGGIWLACAFVDENHYLVAEADGFGVDECLTLYDHSEEDRTQDYPCQVMVWSKEQDELTEVERGQYEALKAALLREMF